MSFLSAPGAFNVAKPSDLIPELQGRFPIRVELTSLNKEDFVRILTEPENALIKQYVALLATEGVQVEFADGRDRRNRPGRRGRQPGRRGHRRATPPYDHGKSDGGDLLQAPDVQTKSIVIDRTYVQDQLQDIIKNQDLRRFIL